MNDTTYILELSHSEIALVAAMAHTILLTYPEHDAASLLIKSLIDQTSIVKADPQEHGVGLVSKSVYTNESHIQMTNARMAAQLDLTALAEGYYEF